MPSDDWSKTAAAHSSNCEMASVGRRRGVFINPNSQNATWPALSSAQSLVTLVYLVKEMPDLLRALPTKNLSVSLIYHSTQHRIYKSQNALQSRIGSKSKT